MTDYFKAQDNLVKAQNKGALVKTGDTCSICSKDIIQSNFVSKTEVLVFNCRHIFHEKCLRLTGNENECSVCIVRIKGAN